MTAQSTPFGKLRSFFWPVHRNEIKIFIPMLIMFFLIALNYNLLRTAKDSLILTAQSSGAEVIPFLKTWAILPMSLLSMVLFTRLSNKYSMERVFYVMLGIFIAFFLLFAVFIYPMHDTLHPHTLADNLEEILPMGFRGFIAVFRNWTFTLFYVMSELWSTAIMTVLFWGFANQITSVEAAKRVYGLLALGANLASICAGELTSWICRMGFNVKETTGEDGWGHSLIWISGVVFLVGFATMLVFRWLNKYAFGGEGVKSASFTYQRGKNEIKMGLRKNFAYLAKSKYLICIAIIVVTYNIAINLTEVVWKDQVRQLYSDPNQVNAYMGRVNECIGIVATVIALISGVVIRRFKWTVGALIPPLIMLVTGGLFFGMVIFKELGWMGGLFALASSPLALVAFLGSSQNILARACKYTFFDNTKELAFIPLSQECKLKGKAAIDGVGSRLGKSGGAFIYQFLLMFFGTISLTIPFVAIALLVVVGAWIIAVRSLGWQFKELMDSHHTLTIPEEEPQPTGQEAPAKT